MMIPVKWHISSENLIDSDGKTISVTSVFLSVGIGKELIEIKAQARFHQGYARTEALKMFAACVQQPLESCNVNEDHEFMAEVLRLYRAAMEVEK